LSKIGKNRQPGTCKSGLAYIEMKDDAFWSFAGSNFFRCFKGSNLFWKCKRNLSFY